VRWAVPSVPLRPALRLEVEVEVVRPFRMVEVVAEGCQAPSCHPCEHQEDPPVVVGPLRSSTFCRACLSSRILGPESVVVREVVAAVQEVRHDPLEAQASATYAS
jgi:hypothetical protein